MSIHHGFVSLLAVGLILLAGTIAEGQDAPGSIRGVVFDKDFDAPIGEAEVVVVDTGQKAATAAQGNFSIPGVKPGEYTLAFSKDGYVRQLRTVVVSSGKLTEVTIHLAGDYIDMEEFIVQDLLAIGGSTEAGLLEFRFQSPSLLDSIGADLMNQAGASDAAAALQLVAGATVQDKSAVIRGLPDRYVSSQVNGVRMPSADEDKRAVELDQFPSAVIESIRVTKTFLPDQQGDASGGAVDVRLKGIPDETFFIKAKAEIGYNSQVTGKDDFVSYSGGGVEGGGRGRQPLGQNWTGAVGVSERDGPADYKWSLASGGNHTFDSGLRIGGFASVFFERDNSFDDNQRDDQWWVESPGSPMTPRLSQNQGIDDFKTNLFDVQQATQTRQWGGLGTFGIESENHAIKVAYLFSETVDDTATLAIDTRGKSYFFPGYDPNNPNSPGYDERGAAPYLRTETLEYTERTVQSLQFSGEHTVPVGDLRLFGDPEFDWILAFSSADQDQPDKRQFGAEWRPGRVVGQTRFPAQWLPYKPAATFTLGNSQRIFKTIEEESHQGALNLRLPFAASKAKKDEDNGYLKFGVFRDAVEREFDQDTYANFNDNSTSTGEFNDPWSLRFPFENHPITDGPPFVDVDYDGRQRIHAAYAMVDVPLTSWARIAGGVRFESTFISIQNFAEQNAQWVPPGASSPEDLTPGAADVDFDRNDWLPAIGLTVEPLDVLTIRASWSQTIARQTFKELTPIQQQEFLGGPVFIGNPSLDMSSLTNYDLRADYRPYQGGLLSVSWFQKEIVDPIENVQRVGDFTFTTAVNYPRGRLRGWEFEVRQKLGEFWDAIDGFSIGANATLIDAKVKIPDDEVAVFSKPGLMAATFRRDMTNAPDHLLNLYLTWESQSTGTRAGIFYTVQGDRLIAGAGESAGNYVPPVYEEDYGTLNVTVTQRIGSIFTLQVKGKNLTNPSIKSVYRSPFIERDVTKTSYKRGIDASVSLAANVRF